MPAAVLLPTAALSLADQLQEQGIAPLCLELKDGRIQISWTEPPPPPASILRAAARGALPILDEVAESFRRSVLVTSGRADDVVERWEALAREVQG